ncbi:MAG: exodeoxyribonuclease V subunit gamma [Lentisphaeria bacterium]|nr:exodeoxyribonuclease V subunit gamma [Lentisphaeria bacterium]
MPDNQADLFEKPFVIRRLGMDALADALIDEINAETRESDPFRKTRVIVPNKSIQRYLFLRFAHRHGIAAQLEFPPLMSVFQRFLPRTDDRTPPSSGGLRINEKTIGWRIYRILRAPESGKEFPALARWINGDSKRLYDLSRRLGALYDKYLLYRPWWINAWEADRVPSGLNDEPAAAWQGRLWRLVVKDGWKGNHFAAVYEKLVMRENAFRPMPDADLPPDSMPFAADPAAGAWNSRETIRIFGFSQLAPTVLQCLEQFSRHGMTVKLYHLVPSGEFYEDCKTHKEELREFLDRYFREGQDPKQIQDGLNDLYFQHNPLLASFAMQNRVLLNRTGEWIDDTDFEVPGERRSGDETILQQLQRRIREDLKPAAIQPEKRKKGSGCRSVQIRNCYSAFREVEAAHNFILHCLNSDHALQLKDIFIMSPSPGDYAPLVDAVFNHSNGAARLGVSIADQPRTERLSAYGAMMKILALFKGDFTASEVFGILQDQALQEHWGITSDDCQYCLERAMRAGIRWGWDAEEHGLSGGKAFPENSWQAGFDRMLLDYAMDADPAAPYPVSDAETVFPVPGFEGGRADLLGKFASLASKFHEIAQTMRGWERNGVPFREWEVKLTGWAGYLFGGDSELKKTLSSALNVWQKVLDEADAEDVPLAAGIVLAYLQDTHAKPEDNTMGFMRGKITFCGLRPMRSIPADMILLLGMDHRTFPEEDDGMEFDIMQQYRKDRDSKVGREPGDPLKRDESRQLFLDTVMAARKYLYISYVGRDIHDRKEKPPSVCVDELGNYLTLEFGKNSFIELKEPLHAFSPELFADGAVNQSFSGKMRDAAIQIVHGGTVPRSGTGGGEGEKPLFDIRAGVHPDAPCRQDPFCRRIELEDLKRFFSNPAGRFVRDRLEASLSVQETPSPEDSEPFENALDWDAKDELFQLYLESADRDALETTSLRRMKANGSIPLTQDEGSWDDWSDMALIARTMESLTQNMSEYVIPAGEMELDYSAADIGDLAKLLYDTVPDCTFRTALVLPELKVFRSSGGGSPQVRLAWSFGNISGARLVGPLLDHVRANLVAATETLFIYIVTQNGNRSIAVAKADAMNPDNAGSILKKFLCLHHAGMWKPLPFFPKSSYAYFGAEESEKARSAKASWDGGWNSKGEVEKFGDCFGTEFQADDRFKALAEAFFGSVVFRCADQGKKKGGRKK